MAKQTRSSKKSAPSQIVIGHDLPVAEVKRLTRLSKAYTKKVNAERIVWPDPDQVDFDGNDIEIDFKPEGFISNKLGVVMRARPKNKKGGGGGKPKLPNPQVVLQEVQASFNGFPTAGATGSLAIAEFNGEFLDAGKAKYFKDVYTEIFSHFHVIFLEEVDCGGVSAIQGFMPGYTGYCSTANTRNQAVAFLVHDRLKVIGKPIEHTAVANVQGIPDLRPAYELKLEDTHTGDKFSVIVVHLKSMRGGPQATAAVRYKQLDILQQALGSKWVGIIGGDFNYKLDDTSLKDGDPLKNNGYTLFMAGDSTATQSMGSRIDGFFHKGLSKQLGFYQVRAYFRNPKITRAFSDHAVLSLKMMAKGTTDDGKDKVDVVSGLVPRIKLLGFVAPPAE